MNRMAESALKRLRLWEAESLNITSRTKDAQGFCTEFDGYRQALVAVAFRITGDIEMSRDIVQDVFASLLAAPNDSFRGRSSLKTYLYRIVINRGIDARRRRVRWFGVLERMSREETLWREATPDANSPENRLLRASLAKMPDKFRIPFLLAESDGMSYNEIADIMKCGINTVRTRIFRCREKLRQEFEKAGYL